MASATATRRTRAQKEAAEKAAAETESAAVQDATDESAPHPRYARKGDLGPATKSWEDVPLERHRDPESGLPILVRVRYLSTAEVVQLSYVPDITGLVEQMTTDLAKRKGSDAKARVTKPIGEWLAEQTETKARVAHVAIADPDKAEEPEACEDCTAAAGGHPIQHRPSLYSIAECGGLTGDELEAIETVALKRQGGAFLRPFSGETSPPNSEQSAATGE